MMRQYKSACTNFFIIFNQPNAMSRYKIINATPGNSNNNYQMSERTYVATSQDVLALVFY